MMGSYNIADIPFLPTHVTRQLDNSVTQCEAVVGASLLHRVTGGKMAENLKKILSQDELKTLAETLVLTRHPPPEDTSDPRPKVRYIATKDTSVLKIMGGVAYALKQRGLQDSAEDLQRLILSGAYETPIDALELIAQYVRLKIVDEQGLEVGDIG